MSEPNTSVDWESYDQAYGGWPEKYHAQLFDIARICGKVSIEAITNLSSNLYPHPLDPSAREAMAVAATILQEISTETSRKIPSSAFQELMYPSSQFVGLLETVAISHNEVDVTTIASHTESRLTPRQTEVFEMIVQGKTYEAIAKELALEVTTINTHVKHILRELQASNRYQALRIGLEAGLVKLNEQETKRFTLLLPRLENLSPRRVEILQMFAQGYKAKDIAAVLWLSESTIIATRKDAYKHLGVSKLRDAIKLLFLANDLIVPTEEEVRLRQALIDNTIKLINSAAQNANKLDKPFEGKPKEPEVQKKRVPHEKAAENTGNLEQQLLSLGIKLAKLVMTNSLSIEQIRFYQGELVTVKNPALLDLLKRLEIISVKEYETAEIGVVSAVTGYVLSHKAAQELFSMPKADELIDKIQKIVDKEFKTQSELQNHIASGKPTKGKKEE